MPRRKVPLENDYYYHVFNRSVGKIPIFTQQRDYERVVELIKYYRFKNTPLPFSGFKKLSQSDREKIINNLEKEANLLIEIIAFCIMPNHFHFLLKQKRTNGIMTFLGNFQNSYAKYFNIKYKRPGGLLQNSFKAVLIEDDPQLLHLSRYIHLNPYSSLMVKRKEDIFTYPWSSIAYFLQNNESFCHPKIVIDQFSSPGDYKNFILNQADYQRELDKIKHLIVE